MYNPDRRETEVRLEELRGWVRKGFRNGVALQGVMGLGKARITQLVGLAKAEGWLRRTHRGYVVAG